MLLYLENSRLHNTASRNNKLVQVSSRLQKSIDRDNVNRKEEIKKSIPFKIVSQKNQVTGNQLHKITKCSI